VKRRTQEKADMIWNKPVGENSKRRFANVSSLAWEGTEVIKSHSMPATLGSAMFGSARVKRFHDYLAPDREGCVREVP